VIAQTEAHTLTLSAVRKSESEFSTYFHERRVGSHAQAITPIKKSERVHHAVLVVPWGISDQIKTKLRPAGKIKEVIYIWQLPFAIARAIASRSSAIVNGLYSTAT
jgi:hypothetical protein